MTVERNTLTLTVRKFLGPKGVETLTRLQTSLGGEAVPAIVRRGPDYVKGATLCFAGDLRTPKLTVTSGTRQIEYQTDVEPPLIIDQASIQPDSAKHTVSIRGEINDAPVVLTLQRQGEQIMASLYTTLNENSP